MRTGYIVLVVAIILAVWRSAPPPPLGVDAPAAAFSASRAYSDVYAIAQRPHPVGSAEHERVRQYIVGRMRALGLSVRLQSERSEVAFPGRTVIAPVTNIIATLPGRDRHVPAVLIMSHYDTVPDSPGAADDTAGVAAALEIARALKASGTPPRDIVFLATDGEELGLMGAAAFFHHDPAAAHIGAVINFETRGDSGLANMFETGPDNAEAVAMYAAGAPHPAANSLSRAIYKAMPNGTDLTVALERNLPALNIAFIADEAAYHSALATPAHLNLGSVQQMGESALGAARAFAVRLPEQKADAVYSDVLGFFVIQYPLWAGWIVLAVAVVLVVTGIRAAQKSAPGWWRGLGAAVLALGLPALALVAAAAAFGGINHFLRLAHFDALLAGAGALAIGLAALVAATVGRRAIRPAALWQVLLLLLVGLGVAAQVLVPEAAFVFVWLALIAGLIATLRFAVFGGRDSLDCTVLCAALAVVPLAMAAAFGIAIFTALGVDLPAVMMLALIIGLPLFVLMPQEKPGRFFPVVLVLGGVALFAYGRFASPSEAHPAPVTIRHVQDLDSGKAWRVSYMGIDPWTDKVLGAVRYSALPWMDGRPRWWAPVAAVAVPDTDVVILREAGRLRVVAQPRPGAWSFSLVVHRSGMPDYEYRVYAPDRDGFSTTLEVPRQGGLSVEVETLYPAWPPDAVPLPSLPPERTAFGNHAATVTIKQRRWDP